MSLSILRSAIVANAFSSDLKVHKSQIFSMITPRGVGKLSTSPKVTIFLPAVLCYFISDQCLKGDRWTTLFLRNLILAMDLQSLRTHKTWKILRGETYASRNLLASTHLLLYRFICNSKRVHLWNKEKWFYFTLKALFVIEIIKF